MVSVFMRFKSLFTTALLFAAVFLYSGCKKDKASEIVFDYSIPFADKMEIDTENVDSLIIRESFDFPTNMDGELAKHNTDKSKIKSAKLIQLRLQVFDFAYADTTRYSNLKDISEIMVDINNDYEGQRPVAFKQIQDVKVKAVNMDLYDQELRDYLKRETFRMVFKYRKRRAMHHEMPFVISTTFRIVADPL